MASFQFSNMSERHRK